MVRSARAVPVRRRPLALIAAGAVVSAAVALVAGGCVVRHAVPTVRVIEVTTPAPADAAPTPTLHAEAPRPLRLVTYNVHREPGARIADALRAEPALRDADVIVMQEVHRAEPTPGHGGGCSGACQLARELGYHAVYAPGHVQDDGTDGVAILARVPLEDAQVIELPMVSTTLNTIRVIALAATVRVDGQPLTVYAVHLANRITVANRRRQMEPVLAHAATHATPAVIAGDVNTSPFTWIGGLVPVLTTTQGRRLEALVRRHGFATPVTGSGATSRYLGMRLDAIYTRGVDVGRHGVADGAGLSDHLALWADITPGTHRGRPPTAGARPPGGKQRSVVRARAAAPCPCGPGLARWGGE